MNRKDGTRQKGRSNEPRRRQGQSSVAHVRRVPQTVDPAVAFAALEERLRDSYDEKTRSLILEGYRAVRPVTLRANTLKTTIEAVRTALDEAGIRWHDVPWSPEALVLEGASEQDVRALPLYEQGEVYLQSLSSMVPPLVLGPHPNDSILDMCAAPGGKTTQMMALSGGRAQITACERSTPRAERLRFNLDRQGAGRVNVLVEDARRLDPFFRFDKILLDAPCSGSGTVTCTQDIEPVVWKTGFSSELLANCMRTQGGLLRKALELLPIGGELVYSTCSILPEENELLVRRVLEEAAQGRSLRAGKGGGGKRGKGRRGEAAESHLPSEPIHAEIVPIDQACFPDMPVLPCSLEGALCIRPTDLYEGFFVCCLRRVERPGA